MPKLSEPEAFWHTVNCAISDDEREAFNRWRGRLYEATWNALETARMHSGDVIGGDPVCNRISLICEIVSEIPTMYP